MGGKKLNGLREGETQSGGSSVEAKSRQNRGLREVVRLKEEKHVHTSSVNSVRNLIKNRKKPEHSVNVGKFLIMFSNVGVLSPDKLIELNAQLKEMENTPQVIALQEVKPKHYRYERITAEYNLEGYDIIEQNLLNKEGRGDFNLPQINWSNYTSVMGLNDVGTMFIENRYWKACTREMYLETEKEYRRLNNQVRWETRNILKRKEQEIAKKVKANPKVFWKYVQTKTRTKARIADLYKDEEKVQKTVNDQEKADVLSEQFSRVFIMEPDRGIPTANKKDVPALEHLEITEGKIRKVIQKLKRHKSPGPDGLHPRVIKEMMEELFQPLRILTKVADHGYHMYTTIKKTTVEKDIGVVIDDKLTFSDHLAEKINKANKIVGTIRRTFVHLDAPIFKALYTALVRPRLEYANQIIGHRYPPHTATV
ncbi:hypothetical protein Hamer_G002947 [Homarus americanus]|uniref:Uncharacterized protein n=1 Tax=Homarus americanus TaxID=6706 RepID=A0A8J5MTG9_HOMAM|nr:hypothetical protein Hamer_G002947 [Homarus americanus]